MFLPNHQPSQGIIIWKPAKNRAIFRAKRILIELVTMPPVIETAKASIANPKAKSTIEKKVISALSYFASIQDRFSIIIKIILNNLGE